MRDHNGNTRLFSITTTTTTTTTTTGAWGSEVIKALRY